MALVDYFKARKLVGWFVAHEPSYFADGLEHDFDTDTLFEALACDWRGYVLVVIRYSTIDYDDPRPQVASRWTHVRDLRRVDYFRDVLGVVDDEAR